MPRTLMKLCCLILLMTVGIAAAAEKPATNSEIRITAEKIEMLREEGCIVLHDNIKVDIEDTKISADKAVVFQDKTSGDYNKVVAVGNVKLVTPDRTVTGTKAVWEKDKNIILITGAPKLYEKDGHTIDADAIRYNLVTKKCTFEGAAAAKVKINETIKKDWKSL